MEEFAVVLLRERWFVLIDNWMHLKHFVTTLLRGTSFVVKQMDVPQICCCNFAKVGKFWCKAN